MARRRISAQEVLDGIMNLQLDESGDESGRDSENEIEEEEIQENSSDSSSDEEEDEGDQGQVQGRDGTAWRIVRTEGAHRGRAEQRNVFHERVGVTRACARIATPLDAWREVFDEWSLRHIVQCTKEFASRTVENWKFTEDDLEKFIGLLYLKGVLYHRNFPFEKLWSTSLGSPAFNRTMPRNRMREIKKFLRFDNRQNRRRNLDNDKFCLISPILDRFVENSQRCFVPGPSLTIDEQLFPTKARCRFTQYMPNKPDKFGIKFWILADLQTKYCYAIKPYLGRDETRQDTLGTHVVMSLMEPLFNKGYNLTVDNFFTSKRLAELLLTKRTTITGTIRANRRELPPPQTLPLYDSVFFECDDLHLTRYQAKTKKVVHILSSQHRGAVRELEGKKKPDTVLFYNANKFGVDILDSMCRHLSTKSGCRRWPLAVFYNILDLAAVNAWILYRKQTGSRISRRNFILELSKELRKDHTAPQRPDDPPVVLQQRVTCAIHVNCDKNRTVNLCRVCDKPVCGKCQAVVCLNCFE